MGAKSQIEWTNATWNPIRGCSRVSEGCRNCYAERQAGRWCGPGEPYEGLTKRVAMTEGDPIYGFPQVKSKSYWTGEVRLIEEHLSDPLRWRKPKRIFVNSMSDLFHEKVQDEWIDRIFAVMALCPQHTFQVLTKRPERMKSYLSDNSLYGRLLNAADQMRFERGIVSDLGISNPQLIPMKWIWWGVSVEDQETANERILLLLKTPAVIRWVSYEPALAPVDFARVIEANQDCEGCPPSGCKLCGLHWLVVGGESGPGARPFNIQWARDVIAQCKAAGVPVFCKQLGAYVISRNDTGFEGDTPRSWPMGTCIEDETTEIYQGAPLRVRLNDRKGGDWNEWPDDLRVREYPKSNDIRGRV